MGIKSIKPWFCKLFSQVRSRISLIWKNTSRFCKFYWIKLQKIVQKFDVSNNYRVIFLVSFTAFLLVFLQIMLFCKCILKNDPIKLTKKHVNSNNNRIEIYDRNGILLAKDIASYDLYIRPYQILDAPAELEKISKIIPKIKNKIPKITEIAALKSKDKVARILVQMGLSDIDRRNLLENGVVGIEFDMKKTRHYLMDNLFAHIIGVTSDDGEGLSGIEKAISQNRIPFEDKVQLSVDVKIQSIMHDSLKNIMQKHKAKGAFGVFIDVNTGEILAGVSLPDYNPNDKSTMTFDNAFNRFSLGTYELGSIFKIINLTLATKHNIPMDRVYDISKDLIVDGKSLGEMQRKRDFMTTEEVLLYSSNIGSGKILLDVGAENQRILFEDLGLTSRVKLELPELGNVMVPSKRDWRGVRAVTMAYGHGIAVTQLHYIRALAAILNGGKLVDLTLLKRGEMNKFYAKDVLDAEISHKMRALVRRVVQEGAGRSAKSAFYDIGGKSGTAIKIKSTGGYDKTKNLVSFFSAFPMNNPKYAMIISLDEPEWKDENRLSLTGGGVFGATAREIIHSSAFFLGVEKVQ